MGRSCNLRKFVRHQYTGTRTMQDLQTLLANKKPIFGLAFLTLLGFGLLSKSCLAPKSDSSKKSVDEPPLAIAREIGDGFFTKDFQAKSEIVRELDNPFESDLDTNGMQSSDDANLVPGDAFSNVSQQISEPSEETKAEAGKSVESTAPIEENGFDAISKKLQEIKIIKAEINQLFRDQEIVVSEVLPHERRKVGDSSMMYVSNEASIGTVWGSGPYATQSNVRGAALHAGAIGSDESGLVRVVVVQAPSTITGSNQNGVTTYPLSNFENAFHVFPASTDQESINKQINAQLNQGAVALPNKVSWVRECTWEQNKTLFSGLDPTGTLLACAYRDGIQYRDAVTGILRVFYPQLGSHGGCLSPSADTIYLNKGIWTLKKDDSTVVKIDCVDFGDSHPASSIYIPRDKSSDEIPRLEASNDGKYLFVKFNERLVLYNLEDKSVELSIDAPKFGESNCAIAYQPELGLLAFLEQDNQSKQIRSLVDVKTGLKTSTPVINSQGKGASACYLWIGKELYEVQYGELRLIDYKNRNKQTVIAVSGMFNSLMYALRYKASNGGVWYNSDNDKYKVALYSLPRTGSTEQFEDDIKYFLSGRWGENRNLFGLLPAAESGTDEDKCFISNDSRFALLRVGGEWQIWRQLDDSKDESDKISKAKEDCRLLAKLWSLGFANKTVEFFKNRGSVRREHWNDEYQNGDPHAACLLGLALITGAGGTKSETKGKALLSQAIERDCLEAVVWQGAFGGDPEKTFARLAQAANSQDPFVLESLANCYRNGIGCDKNDAEAFRLSLLAANLEGGEASALSVGKAYEQGVGTEKDVQKAFQMYRKALDVHASGAGFYVGMCYLNGTGTNQSSEEAFKWLEAESKFPGPLGKYGLGLCFERGVGCTKDIVRANELFEQCSKLGMTTAEAAYVRTKKAAEDVRSERSAEYRRSQDGSYDFYRARRNYSPASAADTMGVMDDARDAVREWRSKVAGELGANGIIFTDSP